MKNIRSRLESESTPLIDGETVTFVWKGKSPPKLRGDFNGWQSVPAEEWQIGPRRLWTHQRTFPADSYIEYCFGDDGERIADPFNSRMTSNGMGFMNHYFYMPDSGVSQWAIRARTVPRGTITSFKVATNGLLSRRHRSLYLYQPPVDQPVPLMVVYDGRDYKNRAKLPIIVDNLIAAGRMAPVALAMLPNIGLGRMSEYACSEGMILFLMHRLLPTARANLNLIASEKHPGAYGVMGASMGGLMALFTGLRLPEIFGHVYSQSGAFEFGSYRSVVTDLVVRQPTPAPRLYLDVGRYEWLLAPNQRMRTALYNHGYQFSYREFNAGHNFPAWRDNLHRGLSWLFPADANAAVESNQGEKRAVNIWGKEFRKV